MPKKLFMVHKNFKQWSSKLILVGALLTMLCSCNNQAKQQEIERQRQDSIQAAERAEKENEEREAAERAEREQREEQRERETFTTSSGTFNIERVLEDCYQQGIHNCTLFGDPSRGTYTPKWRTEEGFKEFWMVNFGIPNNEKANEVFQKGYRKYTQGWDDAANF